MWYTPTVPKRTINGTAMKSATRNTQRKTTGGRRAPNTVNGTVPPRRQVNGARRPREYLTPKEVELLRKAARERGRYGHRDATMIFIAYRHGLRPAELCALRWDQVDLAHGLLHVQRVKNGMPSVHPMGGSEIRDLRRLHREQPEGRHVFLTERSAPMTTAGFRKMLARVPARHLAREAVWPLAVAAAQPPGRRAPPARRQHQAIQVKFGNPPSGASPGG